MHKMFHEPFNNKSPREVKRRVEPLDYVIEQYIGLIILHLVLTLQGVYDGTKRYPYSKQNYQLITRF